MYKNVTLKRSNATSRVFLIQQLRE